MLKKINFIFLALNFIVITSFATTYYLDNSFGNDNNSGTNINSPWKTINKVNNNLFQPGDSILFKCGELWRETLFPKSSGNANNHIVFGSYGNGYKPIISGFSEITSSSWINSATNIWKITLPVEVKNILFNDNQSGIRATSSSLSSPYEFYYNVTTKELFVYATSNPSAYYAKIEASQSKQVISSNNKNYLIFENIAVKGGQCDKENSVWEGGGICLTVNSQFIEVKNNEIYYCQGSGIRVLGSDNILISGNSIRDINSHSNGLSGDGVLLQWDRVITTNIPVNVNIVNNTFTGYIDRQGIAIVNGDNIHVRNNTLSFNSIDGYAIGFEPNDGTTNKVINSDITGNIVNAALSTGIAVSGEISYNVLVKSNTINLQGNVGTIGVSLSDFGVNLPAGFVVSHFATIENNKIYNCERGIRIGSMFSEKALNINANFILSAGANSEIGIHLKDGGKSNCTNNIITGEFKNAVEVIGTGSSAVTTGDFYHNVFCNYTINGVYARNYTNVKSKNNIFFTAQNFSYHFNKQASSSYISNKNIYYPSGNYYRWGTSTYSINNLVTSTGQEANGMENDPLFENASSSLGQENDFKLQSNSIAIDAAEDVNVQKDYINHIRFDAPISNTGFAGNYFIDYADIGAFEYSSSMSISFNYTDSVCEGSNATILAIVTGGVPPYSYLWNTGGITSGITVVPGFSDYYSVLVTDANGETIEDSVFINVIKNDDASFSYSKSFFCLNEGNAFPIIQGNQGGIFTINNNGIINSATGEITFTSSGSYTIVYTTNGFCPDSDSFNINVGSVTFSNLLLISHSSYISPSGRYEWSASGFYYDTITNAAGCDSIITIDLTIRPTNSTMIKSMLVIDTKSDNNSIEIFPNPGNGLFHIKHNGGFEKSYNVCDYTGKFIKSGSLLNDLNEIDLQNFPNGIYWLQINSGENTIQFKLIKQ